MDVYQLECTGNQWIVRLKAVSMVEFMMCTLPQKKVSGKKFSELFFGSWSRSSVMNMPLLFFKRFFFKNHDLEPKICLKENYSFQKFNANTLAPWVGGI